MLRKYCSPNNDNRQNKWLRLFTLLTLFAVLAITLSLTLGSACIIYLILGFPCPACGMTRANLLALNFHFHDAFKMHPLFFFSGLILLCTITVTYNPKINKSLIFNVLCALAGMAFVITYIVRMVMFYPGDPPLEYNENSVLALIIKWIRALLSS